MNEAELHILGAGESGSLKLRSLILLLDKEIGG
jgi:hypothetical protein